ncbi:MAG: protein YgfX [Casimicrobiaceae bacterium]
MVHMHRAPPLEIALSPSRTACAWIVGLAWLTLALSFTLPIPGWVGLLATLPLAVWSALRFRGHHAGGAVACRLRLDGDRMLSITTVDGRTSRGRVLPSTYVGARLTTLVWRPQGEGWRFARAECVLPDMLPPEDFRRLRVLLRYGRSELTQGAPPSQA